MFIYSFFFFSNFLFAPPWPPQRIIFLFLSLKREHAHSLFLSISLKLDPSMLFLSLPLKFSFYNLTYSCYFANLEVKSGKTVSHTFECLTSWGMFTNSVLASGQSEVQRLMCSFSSCSPVLSEYSLILLKKKLKFSRMVCDQFDFKPLLHQCC